jgi:hypothetical protein
LGFNDWNRKPEVLEQTALRRGNLECDLSTKPNLMLKVIAVCLCFFVPGFCSAQAVPQSPDSSSCQQFAQRFYDWYVPFTQIRLHGPSADVALQRRPETLSPELLNALRADSMAQAHAKEIVGLDFDPFLGSQDPADHYEARQATAKNGTCSVGIWRSSPTDTAAKINEPEAVAELKQENGRWRFVNFKYPPEGQDLLRLLADLRKERRSRGASTSQ